MPQKADDKYFYVICGDGSLCSPEFYVEYQNDEPIQVSPLARAYTFNVGKIKIDIKPISYTGKKPFPGNSPKNLRAIRFGIWINDGEPNDELARRISDALRVSTHMAYGPYLSDAGTPASLLKLPEDLLENGHSLKHEKIARYQKNPREDRWPEHIIYLSLHGGVILPPDIVERIFEFLPLFLGNNDLFAAAHYLLASEQEYFFLNSVIDEILTEPDSYPGSAIEQAKMEGAAQNAFKSIEALIGEPPRDTEKLMQKIRGLGVDPEVKVGLQSEKTTFEMIREVHEFRDKRAAHAKTPHRKPITFLELAEIQYFAKNLLHEVIGKRPDK